MGRIRVEMKASAKTGRKKVVVYYESDPTLTYQEHLKRHREIIDHLLSLRIITQADIGNIEFRVLEPESVELDVEIQTREDRETRKETT